MRRFVTVMLGALVGLSANAENRPLASAVLIDGYLKTFDVVRSPRIQLLAVGRLDRISSENSAVVTLGRSIILLASVENRRFVSDAAVGDAIALFGELDNGIYFATSAVVLNEQYVPGVSRVYLRAAADKIDRRTGTLSVGSVEFDFSGNDGGLVVSGQVAHVAGTQPAVGGKVLVDFSYPVEGEFVDLGILESNASLGTGRADASLGTGRADASLGTGRAEASLGTGRADASLGTGRADASLGTGRADASLGTGRADASLGMGRADASLALAVPMPPWERDVLTHR